jgi:hypothetical protein
MTKNPTFYEKFKMRSSSVEVYLLENRKKENESNVILVRKLQSFMYMNTRVYNDGEFEGYSIRIDFATNFFRNRTELIRTYVLF